MNRNLHRCPICREWFNTTSAVMIDHYRTKHERQAMKAFALAGLAFQRAMLTAQANAAPWALSMQYAVSAIMTSHQIDRIIQERA